MDISEAKEESVIDVAMPEGDEAIAVIDMLLGAAESWAKATARVERTTKKDFILADLVMVMNVVNAQRQKERLGAEAKD
jgi:hypothetical protein